MPTSPTASAPGTDQRGANRDSTSQQSNTGTTNSGAVCRPSTGARHNGRRTPASMACARDVGMLLMSLPQRADEPGHSDQSPGHEKGADGGRPPAVGNSRDGQQGGARR